ncbi:myozenin-1-like [Polymixia lowei]
MPLGTPASQNKRKNPSRIITDLSHITQDEYESEPEVPEFDLGTKIRTPKDIMLEELSRMKNRGSKMFKMRQKRVEMFIYNNPDLFSNESMENFQKLSASLGGQMMDVGGHLIGRQAGGQAGGGAPVPPPKPGSKGAGARGAAGGAGGAGGSGHGQGGTATVGFAVPFGGFEKANQLLKFQLPDTEVPKEQPEPAVVLYTNTSSALM